MFIETCFACVCCRGEAVRLSSVWQGLQSVVEPHHTQSQTHRVQAVRVPRLLQGVPAQGRPSSSQRNPAPPGGDLRRGRAGGRRRRPARPLGRPGLPLAAVDDRVGQQPIDHPLRCRRRRRRLGQRNAANGVGTESEVLTRDPARPDPNLICDPVSDPVHDMETRFQLCPEKSFPDSMGADGNRDRHDHN